MPPYPQAREARMELINKGNMRSMLLESAANRSPIDPLVKYLIKGRNTFLVDDNQYGLEKYEYPVVGPNKLRGRDILFEKGENGKVVSFLRCSFPNQHENPSCEHKFIDKGVLYKISWPIRELPNWQEQRDKAVAFIDSFEITDINGDE